MPTPNDPIEDLLQLVNQQQKSIMPPSIEDVQQICVKACDAIVLLKQKIVQLENEVRDLTEGRIRKTAEAVVLGILGDPKELKAFLREHGLDGSNMHRNLADYLRSF